MKKVIGIKKIELFSEGQTKPVVLFDNTKRYPRKLKKRFKKGLATPKNEMMYIPSGAQIQYTNIKP
ncbi:hypothetical protein [Albibacterium profundi]|uniref:Uncharacterized protein n=1 Tax=Albibacterium profundi TaxID=3134906 RepID=A0ABV5CEW3_9SPHI